MPAAYWIQGLPPKSLCDSITDYYFQHVAWNHSIVLESAFRSFLSGLWKEGAEEERVSTACVVLYFMVLYHGVSNMDPEDPVVSLNTRLFFY